MSARRTYWQSAALFDWVLGLCAGILTLGETLRLRSIMRFWDPDLLDYTRWYSYILAHGRLSSLNGSFSSYNPPYLYVLAVISNLSPWHGPNTMVKLANVPFILGGAALTYGICRFAGCTTRRALLAGWLVAVSPEVIANALCWGQTDMLESMFVLWLAFLLLRRHPYWAMLAGGVALCFKLQAVFIGPAILALCFTGEIPWLALLNIPVGYLLMMLPAELAGRPLNALFGAYSGQVQVPERISMGAVNIYRFLLPFTGMAEYGARVWWIDHLGVLFAALVTVALIVFLVRHRPLLPPHKLLLALTISAVAEPSLLPKMHERYFFIGDLLALVLGTLAPRFSIPAALLQVVAISAYAPYLISFRPPTAYYVLPFAMAVAALVLLCRQLRNEDTLSTTGPLHPDPRRS